MNNPLSYIDLSGEQPISPGQKPITLLSVDPGDRPGNGSLYKWLYTGDWCAPDNVYQAALNGSAEGLTCWADCMADANKQISAIVAAALGTCPAWGVPKPQKWLVPGARSMTSVARSIAIQIRRRFGSDVPATRLASRLANFVKKNPRMAAAKLALVVCLWTEAAISAYCASQCMDASGDDDGN